MLSGPSYYLNLSEVFDFLEKMEMFSAHLCFMQLSVMWRLGHFSYENIKPRNDFTLNGNLNLYCTSREKV